MSYTGLLTPDRDSMLHQSTDTATVQLDEPMTFLLGLLTGRSVGKGFLT